MGPSSQSPLPRFQAEPGGEAEPGSVEEALEEAEFFAARGLFEDAMLILSDQLDRAPSHPLLLEALHETRQLMEAARSNPAPAEEASQPRETLAPSPESVPRTQQSGRSASTSESKAGGSKAEKSSASGAKPTRAKRGAKRKASERPDEGSLKEQLGELERVVRESQNPPPGKRKKKATLDVDKVFDNFKARVKSEVADHDSSTHYDLGVAYKEMRLFGDAIEELKLAARDAAIECNCYSMIGMIHAEQGKWEETAKALTRALNAAKKTVAQEANLYYDLGSAHEQMGRDDRAAYYFQQALRRDASFRDTKERISKLKKSKPPSGPPGTADDELDRAFEELMGD
jgi:tetratricopeptide (TPR) repeat protein